MTWIDWLALLTLAVAFCCGWSAGLLAEVFDVGSLAVGIAIAAWLDGGLAAGLPPTWPLSDSARHLFAFWLLFVVVYGLMRFIGWYVVKFREWTVAKWVGGVGGGVVAVSKVLVTFFVVLYLALFLPIDPQIRATLRQSPLAVKLDSFFPPINDAFIAMAPRATAPQRLYQKLVVRPLMNAHRL